jgi:hypothetical protein
MTNTTMMTMNIPNQIKDDFKTVCTFNQSTMTSEIVRFINTYISQEGSRLKQYQQTSNEINELKQRKLTTKPPIPQPQRSFNQKTWENSY